MSRKPEEPFLTKEDAEPTVDLKVLDNAILKVLAHKPKPAPKPESTPRILIQTAFLVQSPCPFLIQVTEP